MQPTGTGQQALSSYTDPVERQARARALGIIGPDDVLWRAQQALAEASGQRPAQSVFRPVVCADEHGETNKQFCLKYFKSSPTLHRHAVSHVYLRG